MLEFVLVTEQCWRGIVGDGIENGWRCVDVVKDPSASWRRRSSFSGEEGMQLWKDFDNPVVYDRLYLVCCIFCSTTGVYCIY